MIRTTPIAKAYDTSFDAEAEFYAKTIVDAFVKNGHYTVAATANPTWQEAVKLFAEQTYYVHGNPQLFDKIQVIRFARNLGNLGLKEAKDWVEANILRFRVQF